MSETRNAGRWSQGGGPDPSARLQLTGRKLEAFGGPDVVLTRGTLSRSVLVKPRLSKTAAVRADLEGARLEEGDFSEALCIASNWKNAEARDTSFRGCDLRGGDLASALFRSCDFRGANLAGANAPFASFVDCDFSKANLTGVEFLHVRFSRCRLEGAILQGASFVNSLCIQTSFAGCQMAGSDWSKSRFQEVDFEKAAVRAARFWSVRGLSDGQMERLGAEGADVVSPFGKAWKRWTTSLLSGKVRER